MTVNIECNADSGPETPEREYGFKTGGPQTVYLRVITSGGDPARWTIGQSYALTLESD